MKKRFLPPSLKKTTYIDFDLQFRAHPVTGKLITKKDDDAVKQSVKNIVLTNRLERPFRSEFGGDIRRRLFDNFDSISETDYTNQIENTISNFEPRVELKNNSDFKPVTVTEFPDQNEMHVTVKFRNVSTLNALELDINLNKVR